ncbi:hypothetical protein PUN28_015950 [Cardiocondyla obscurior]|uniref:Uncharacterized protein n=1 Tax=Cardiocondyla obscurior TaxID=286306 RepID=A0AAW2EQ99_9HYME
MYLDASRQERMELVRRLVIPKANCPSDDYDFHDSARVGLRLVLLNASFAQFSRPFFSFFFLFSVRDRLIKPRADSQKILMVSDSNALT